MDVFYASDSFKMGWPYASAVSAKVINLKLVRDWAMSFFVSPTMRHYRDCVVQPKSSVAKVLVSSPQPAVAGLVYFGPESFGYGNSGGILIGHRAPLLLCVEGRAADTAPSPSVYHGAAL
jgi:hypothetical protein